MHTRNLVRHGRTAVLVTAACAAAVGVAACGSSSSSSTTGAGGTSGSAFVPTDSQKKGGTLKVVSAEGFEHLDPGQAYFQIDYTVVYATQRPLYSFKPTDATNPEPDLADGPPKISSDGKTVTFAPLASLAPKAKTSWKVVVKGVKAGDTRFKVSMTSDQMTRPVEETESTNFYQ